MRICTRTLLLILAVAGSSCVTLFDPPTLVNTLRVLAVRADHPTPKLGTDVTLDMLIFDGSESARASDGTNRAVQLTWLSGCFNPPSDVYTECFPLLQPALDALSSGAVSSSVGHDGTFALHVPDEIISSHPSAGHGQVPYGVSFVFYAVCAGQVQVQDTQDKTRPPLRCVASNGVEVGAEGFVFGYLPLYSYDGVENQNPVVTGVLFDSVPDSTKPCAVDSDCDWAQACGSQHACVDVIAPCTSCAQHSFAPLLDTSNAELDPIATAKAGAPRTERLAVTYYASSGSIGGTRVINDPVIGWQSTFDTTWTASSGVTGETHLWAIVRDGRGGVAWWDKEVIVR